MCLLGCLWLLQQKTPNQLAGVSYIPRSKRSGCIAKPLRTQLICVSVFFHSWCQLPGSAVGLGVKSRHNIQLMERLALPVVSLSVQTPLLKCLLPILQQTSLLDRNSVAMPSRIQDPWGIGIGGREGCWTGSHQCLLQGAIESCKHGTIWVFRWKN